MRVDFREERKWKIALAFSLSTAVLEWHAAGNWAERVEKGICIGGKRLRFQDDDPEVGLELIEEQVKLETEEPVQAEQLKTSLLEVDYGSDDDDDDDESVVDQQNVLDTLEPAVLIQDALDVAQADGNWTAVQDVRPKAEVVEDSVLVSDGTTNTLMVENQDTMDIDGADGTAPDVPKLKATSSDPILSSNPASKNNDVGLSTAQTKSLSKTNIYAPLRDHIAYSNDDKLLLGPEDFHNLADDVLLPPADLSTIFPDLQPVGLSDVPPAIAPSTNEGKKRSEKRSERDDPARRSEDTTYTKLFPAGEFMYSKPTLLGPLHPSRYYKDGRWVIEESAVLPDSDGLARTSDNTLSGECSLNTIHMTA
jgi:chromatin modification-related protein VID21